MNKRLKYLENLADQQDFKASEHYNKCKYCKSKRKGKKPCAVYSRLVALLWKTDDLITELQDS